MLAKMRAASVIDPATYERASAQRVSFADFKGERTANGFEYAIDMALEKLPPLLGEDHGEIIVETTIDAALQKRANAIVRAALDAKGATVKASQAALVTTDPDGGIRALIGGRSFAESQFNRATKARRQPGSVFKPFVYLTAIEQGMTPDTITYDLPITIDGWSPRNDNNRHAGALTLRQALAQSVNTVAVRLAGNAGLPAVSATARRLGIQSDLREDLSMALGTSELSLLELVSAYTVFSNGGDLVEPHIIRRVRLSNGRVLYARQAPLVQRVVSLQHVGAINDMLHSALTAGTGRRAALLHQPAAGKTGTTQDYRDAWFIGYTSHMTTGVWIGNDDGTPMRRVMGGTLPAEIWHDVMAEAHRDLRPMALPGMISLDAVAMAGQDSSARGSDVVEKRYWQIGAPATTSSTRGATSGTGRARTAEKSPSIAPSAAPIPMRASKLARAADGKPLPRRAVIGQRLVIEPPKVPSGVATAGPQNTSSSGVPAPAKSTAGQHPSERISADFLARVLTEPSAQEKTETAASQSGFDADAILRQLEAIPDSGRPASRAGLMALGAGASR